MSIAETLQRPAVTNGLQRHLPMLRPKETEAKEREVTTQTTPSVAAVRCEREKALEANANAVLGESSYHAVRNVSCEVCGCVLILQGRVPSFYMKQIAQEIVRQLLDGNLVIQNQLEVDRTERSCLHRRNSNTRTE